MAIKIESLKDLGRDDFYYFIYLCNCVFGLDDRQDCLLLDWGRLLKTEGVDATQDFLLEPHVVKFINFHFPVRFETFFSFLSYKNDKNRVLTQSMSGAHSIDAHRGRRTLDKSLG